MGELEVCNSVSLKLLLSLFFLNALNGKNELLNKLDLMVLIGEVLSLVVLMCRKNNSTETI